MLRGNVMDLTVAEAWRGSSGSDYKKMPGVFEREITPTPQDTETPLELCSSIEKFNADATGTVDRFSWEIRCNQLVGTEQVGCGDM